MKGKILILDDDAAILDVLQEAFKMEDLEAECFRESEELINSVKKGLPDVVLIDYLLRDINGGEICHQLKTSERTCNIPVVMMSASPQLFESLGTYGCDAFVSKPFDLHQLMSKIKGYLRIDG